MNKIAIILTISLILNSCSRTVNAWNGSTPSEYLEIYGNNELPSKLEEKKVKYRCVDLIYSNAGNTKKCYVTKNSSEKIDGWSSHLYETSKGVLLDSGENLMVLGVLALCSLGGNCYDIDFENIKIKE